MAEYIGKDIAIQICRDSWDTVDAIQDIKDEPSADVVERAKYEMMAERCKAMTNAFVELRKDNKELRSKIDKAIEEMRCYLKTTPSNEEFINGIEHSIEILKRNIGE